MYIDKKKDRIEITKRRIDGYDRERQKYGQIDREKRIKQFSGFVI